MRKIKREGKEVEGVKKKKKKRREIFLPKWKRENKRRQPNPLKRDRQVSPDPLHTWADERTSVKGSEMISLMSGQGKN